MSYLAPIRLYIFISFVTFFLIAVLPQHENKNNVLTINATKTKIDSIEIPKEKWIENLEKQGIFNKKKLIPFKI